MIKRIIAIQGMHCASCVRLLEKSLSKIDGVSSCNVNLINETATLNYDSKKVSDDQIQTAVSAVGYKALTQDQRSEKDVGLQKQKELSALKIKVIFSLSLGALIVWGSLPVFESLVPPFLQNPFVLLLLATPVQFWARLDFYKATLPALRNRTANMDTLVTIGTSVAYLYSVFVTFLPGVVKSAGVEPMPYFDVAAVVIGLILLGRYFEAKAKAGTSEAIKKLLGLQAKTAIVIRDGKEISVPIDQVGVGDLIRVRPGEKIPVDGVIVEGETSIDESMVTGESIPSDKAKDDVIIGATINKSGTFIYKATKVGSETMLAQIIKLVQEAQGSKAPIQRFADLISSYFVPIVIMLAILTFMLWYVVGPTPALLFAILNSIAVLIIACPCAMGLATPTAIMVGTGIGAQQGILIKDAQSLEIAHKVNTVIFDKTGTLTVGKPEVKEIVSLDSKVENLEILVLAASVEKGSEHSLAEAILKKAEEEKVILVKIEGFKAVPGYGVEGKLDGEKVLLGNRKLMEKEHVDFQNSLLKIENLENKGQTVMLVAKAKKLIGLIAVADTIKESAKKSIEMLHKMGIETVLLTGDNSKTASAVAHELGIKRVLAEVIPEEKETQVRKIQAEKKVVAMVGDGINDAPALAASDVGIAMGSGTDIAIESADITLINKDLTSLPKALILSRKTMKTIKTNLFWAFGYNVVLIPVAMGALYPFFGLLLNPIFASAAMALSSVSVVGNSLLLKKTKLI